ncbi:MAG: formylglycine-generating enzyme family protein, partial [Anaerolineae bacterium]|nr:formylglycine-generating enzyme family protein [Anaerolineae bacterium]
MMRCSEHLTEISILLATNCGINTDNAIVLAASIGIDSSRISEKQNALKTWFDILEIADQNGAHVVERLIAKAKASYGNPQTHQKIDEFFSAYLKCITEPLQNPYPGGLQPFGINHKEYFFGREKEITTTLEELKHYGYVVIYGRSGGGKSSLLVAGVLKDIEDTYVLFKNSPIRPSHLTQQEIESITQSSEQRSSEEQYGRPLLFAFDQFEELYGSQVNTSIKQNMIEWLKKNIQVARTTQTIAIIICVRSDFIDELIEDSLWPKLPSMCICVLPLEGDALKKAIAAPASKQGVKVDAALLETIAKESEDQQGALPLVQEAMHQLWERVIKQDKRGVISLADYRAVTKSAGLATIISRYAEEVYYGEFDDKQKVIAMRSFIRMVEFTSGRKNVRRQQKLYDFYSCDFSKLEIEKVLNTLLKKRLITIDKEDESSINIINISHEILIGEWQQLRTWIEQYQNAEVQRREYHKEVIKWKMAVGLEKRTIELNKSLSGGIKKWTDEHGDNLGVSNDFQNFFRSSKKTSLENRLVQLLFITTLLSLFPLGLIIYQKYLLHVIYLSNYSIEFSGSKLLFEDLYDSDNHIELFIEPFKLDQFEVSNRQMCLYLRWKNVLSPWSSEISNYCNVEPGYPAVNVDLNEASSFCSFISGEIPNELQWEYAARGGKSIEERPYPIGKYFHPGENNVGTNAVTFVTSTVASTKDITAKEPYHMTGNVREWTISPALPYTDTFYLAPINRNSDSVSVILRGG